MEKRKREKSRRKKERGKERKKDREKRGQISAWGLGNLDGGRGKWDECLWRGFAEGVRSI